MPESTKRPAHRPVGTGKPPEERREAGSIRLRPRHWAMARALGSERLDAAIEAAHARMLREKKPLIP